MKFFWELATGQSTGARPWALPGSENYHFGWALAMRLQSLAARQRATSWRRLLRGSRGLDSKSCPV
jgi:hypothetical protein